MSFISKSIGFLGNLISEIALNGKALAAWVLLEIPAISDYPGIVEALNRYIEDPSKQNLINLFWQCLFAGAAGHRFWKILAKLLRGN